MVGLESHPREAVHLVERSQEASYQAGEAWPWEAVQEEERTLEERR